MAVLPKRFARFGLSIHPEKTTVIACRQPDTRKGPAQGNGTSLTYQDQMLCLKLRGHFRSYGIGGNFRLLEEVLRFAETAWRYWLSRRSGKSAIGWENFQQLLKTSVLPTPKIVHNI